MDRDHLRAMAVLLSLGVLAACGSSSSSGGTSSSSVSGSSTFTKSWALDNGDGDKCSMELSGTKTMTTAEFTIGVAGQLITHVSDSDDIGRHVSQVDPGISPTFTYPYPPSRVDDVGAVLYVGSAEYACTITQK